MKFLGFYFLVLMMTSVMVTQAQIISVFYGKNHTASVHQFRYCYTYKDATGNPATLLYIFPLPLKCNFFSDAKCKDITTAIPPTQFPANKLIDLKQFDPSDTSAPASFQCHLPID